MKGVQTATFPVIAMTVAVVTKQEREPSLASEASVMKADLVG